MGTEHPFVDQRKTVGVIFLGTEGYMIIPDYSSDYTFLSRKREPKPSDGVPAAPTMDTGHFKNRLDTVRSRNVGEIRFSCRRRSV